MKGLKLLICLDLPGKSKNPSSPRSLRLCGEIILSFVSHIALSHYKYSHSIVDGIIP